MRHSESIPYNVCFLMQIEDFLLDLLVNIFRNFLLKALCDIFYVAQVRLVHKTSYLFPKNYHSNRWILNSYFVVILHNNTGVFKISFLM